MGKKLIIFLITLIVLIILVFFIKSDYKLFNFGNNMSNKSIEEFEKYILNIESYELIAEISVQSNKNDNKYTVKQQYIKEDKIYKQEYIKPESISGLTFIYNNQELKLENTKLNLTKIYENYQYITENNLSLNSFIQSYMESDERKCYEKNGQIILETKQKNGNRYTYSKTLYLDRKTGNPTKMEVRDVTQKTLIYILYNEVKINDLRKEDMLAVKLIYVGSEI